jgi:molybdopterin converting factor small subunit
VKVVLSGTLQRYADYRREHIVEGATLGEVLLSLAAEYPGIGSALFDDDESIGSTHALFVNGEHVEHDLERSVQNWDELEIITALAGG